MAWRRIGDKPLSEPVLTRFADAYMGIRGGGGGGGGWVKQTENEYKHMITMGLFLHTEIK